jgi:hypothetical protein
MRAAGGGGRAPFGVSPYVSARFRGQSVPAAAMMLPDRFNPTVRKPSLLFSELAETLEVLSNAKTKDLQGEILRDLFHRTIAAAGGDPGSAELEMYLLLKMLMPTEDHESVYGMKTARLLRFVGRALEKIGISDAPAQIKQWISKPQAQSSIMARGRGVVCLPELIVASQCCRVNKTVNNGHRGIVTLRDIGALCQRLSRAYLMMESQTSGAELNQIENLKEILGYLSFNEWMLLTRIIYKTIPVGIGPAAILSNVAPNGQVFYSKRRDLASLAQYAAVEAFKHKDDQAATPVPLLVCGVPFVPMTCETMKSPYLFRWLFSKEDKLRKPISPVDGRLIILSSGMWCTPVDGRLNKSVFVDIMDDRAMAKASRRRHVLLLREFKRSRLLDESKARGYIIHYILSSENDNVVMMLLKAVSDAVGQGASMLDAAYQIEVREDAELELNNDIDDLDNEVYVNGLLKALVQNNEEKEYLSGKNKLKISILSAPRRRPPKKPKRRGPATTRRPTTTKKKSSQGKTAAAVAEQVARHQARRAMEKEKSSRGGYNLRPRRPNGAMAVDFSSSDDDDGDDHDEGLSSSRPIEIEDNGDNNDNGDDNIEKPSVMVQQKYDGDRIQVHINRSQSIGAAAQATTTVTLFTKWGKDVSELYSNIRDELRDCRDLAQHAPCILDAELIVIDASGYPIPWSNEKWRHNVNGKATFSLSEIPSLHTTLTEDTSNVVTLIYDNGLDGGQATINNSSEDIQDQRLAFATLRGLEKWAGLGPTDKHHMMGRFISDNGSRLRLIVFDILMHSGDMSHKLPCRDRLNLLQRKLEPIFKPMTHIRVIEKTHNIRKVSELVKLLRDVVSEKQEGLVAKDEEKEYVFGRTKATQKIKLTGPDINTCVAGIGFSLSSNPRFCGILTAVGWKNEEDGENLLVSYSRTEVLEGDQIWKAHEHIMSLPSRVNLEELDKAASSGKAVELEKYRVTMISTGSGHGRRHKDNDSNICQVEWTPRSPENAYLGCKLILLKRGRADIQWLCNPQECKFGLSLKGDLRPIESDGYGNQNILHHRHPVGRIEFAGHQMSACDNNKTIETKFREAQMTATCIEDFTYRRINRMRALPPSKKKLEEIRRIVETIQSLNNNSHDGPAAEEEEWPRPPPVGFCSPDGFSLMLENVSKYPTADPRLNKSQESAFKKLTPEERQAWVGLPVHSQWKNMGSVAPAQIPLVDDALSQERQRANIASLMSRYERIRTVTPPFEQEYKLANTSQKFSSQNTKAIGNHNPRGGDVHVLCSLPNSSSYPEHGTICGDGRYDTHFLDSDEDNDEDHVEYNEEEEEDDEEEEDSRFCDDEEQGFGNGHAKMCERQKYNSDHPLVQETPIHYLLHPATHRDMTLPAAAPPPFRGLHHEKSMR